MTVDPLNPFHFNFLVSEGSRGFKGDALKREADKLIKYFLASLTIPEKDLWVNLSFYEKERIINKNLGVTQMGRDMLMQDYFLKKLTASLTHPENEVGKRFWEGVYEKVHARFDEAEVPVDVFQKVWIVPDKAVVYVRGNTAFVAEAALKVLSEEDYRAYTISGAEQNTESENTGQLSSEIMKKIIIPELEKELNGGEVFAPLRQIYHSLILADWFKKNLRESLLSRVYADQDKIFGVDEVDENMKKEIFDRYYQVFQDGVFAHFKEEYDPVSKKIIPRKYFSGGVAVNMDRAESVGDLALLSDQGKANIAALGTDKNGGALTEVSAVFLDPERPGNVSYQQKEGGSDGAMTAGEKETSTSESLSYFESKILRVLIKKYFLMYASTENLTEFKGYLEEVQESQYEKGGILEILDYYFLMDEQGQIELNDALFGSRTRWDAVVRLGELYTRTSLDKLSDVEDRLGDIFIKAAMIREGRRQVPFEQIKLRDEILDYFISRTAAIDVSKINVMGVAVLLGAAHERAHIDRKYKNISRNKIKKLLKIFLNGSRACTFQNVFLAVSALIVEESARRAGWSFISAEERAALEKYLKTSYASIKVNPAKAVVFDLSHVLVRGGMDESIQRIADHFGIKDKGAVLGVFKKAEVKHSPADYWREVVTGISALVKQAVEAASPDQLRNAEYFLSKKGKGRRAILEERMIGAYAFVPGMKKLIKRLKKAGYDLYIFTSKPIGFIEDLKRSGIKYLDEFNIVNTETLNVKKTDDLFGVVLRGYFGRTFGLKNEDFIYVTAKAENERCALDAKINVIMVDQDKEESNKGYNALIGNERIQWLVAEAEGEKDKGRDQAMGAQKARYGGVDFNMIYADMQIKTDGKGKPLDVGFQDLERIQIDGLVPVIIDMTPVTDLLLLLGMSQEEKEELLAG